MTGRNAAELCIWLFVAALPLESNGQDSSSVHWAYSAYFGTGWYSVAGDRDVFVFRVTPEWELSEPSFENGKRESGWYLKTPVVTGLDQFDVDDIPDAVDLDNVAFLSVNSVLELELPINRIWSLRPYASVGFGSAINDSENAWTYWAGIKSRLLLHEGERSSWRLVNNLGYVGYTPNNGSSDSFWPAMAGIEVSHPLGSKQTGGEPAWLVHWNAGYTYFGDDIFFSRAPNVNQNVSDQWEIGIALGKREEPIKIWFVNFNRLGLGYRESSDGSLTGVTFIFRSAFTR